MSHSITCPVCGPRDLAEFRFGNEDHGPVADVHTLERGEYVAALLMQQTEAGPQKEWWCHAAGCGTWFTTRRDTLTGREIPEKGADL